MGICPFLSCCQFRAHRSQKSISHCLYLLRYRIPFGYSAVSTAGGPFQWISAKFALPDFGDISRRAIASICYATGLHMATLAL